MSKRLLCIHIQQYKKDMETKGKAQYRLYVHLPYNFQENNIKITLEYNKARKKREICTYHLGIPPT